MTKDARRGWSEAEMTEVGNLEREGSWQYVPAAELPTKGETGRQIYLDLQGKTRWKNEGPALRARLHTIVRGGP